MMGNRKSSPVYALLAIILILSSLMAGCSPDRNVSLLTRVKKFEGGAAYKTSDDAYWALSLSGSWRKMGRQYGGLVAAELRQFHIDIAADVAARGMDYDAQLTNAKALAESFSQDLNELLAGIAETSGLTEDEVLVLNAGILHLSALALGAEAPSSCSGLAVWDKYTSDGKLIFGRNWDIDRKSLLPYMKYLSVVVFNPDSGNGFANVHPLGSVYLETGMNEKGLFIELNNGAASDPNYIEDRTNTVSVLATALNKCSAINDAAQYLTDTPADLSYILQIADSKQCVSVERATFGVRVRAGEQAGVLAAYNSFIPPYPGEWKDKVTAPPTAEEDPRYQNLLALANSQEFFGKLNIDSMQTLLDIGVRNGGATHNGTVYQVIAIPADLTLWVRALDYSEWQQVCLQALFR